MNHTILKDNKPMVGRNRDQRIVNKLLELFSHRCTTILLAALILYLLLYIIGGFQSSKEGLQDTFQNKNLNVDILMVLSCSRSLSYWLLEWKVLY